MENEIFYSFVLHLCIICQKKKNQNLVEKPEAHEKVRVSIEEWSKYGNLHSPLCINY